MLGDDNMHHKKSRPLADHHLVHNNTKYQSMCIYCIMNTGHGVSA